MDNQIRAILFDLGNVLVSFDHTRAASRIAPFAGRKADEIYELFFDSQLTGLFEEGKIPAFDFFLKVKEILRCDLPYEEFVRIWNEIFFETDENRRVYALARRLKEQYRVGIATNINVLHYEYLKVRFPVFDAAHEVLTSFELGARKPDPSFYARALETLGVLPAQAFYTDDRADLVAEAGKLGMHAFVFRDAKRLTQDLIKANVSIP